MINFENYLFTTATVENIICFMSLVGLEIFENTMPVINELNTKLPKLSIRTKN